MSSTPQRPRPDDPLRHLRGRAAVGATTPRRASRNPRSLRNRHRNLVRFGWVLIAVAPLFALSHLLVDALSTEAVFTRWTTTIASYDVVVITVIIGIALVCRTAPTVGDSGVTARQPSS